MGGARGTTRRRGEVVGLDVGLLLDDEDDDEECEDALESEDWEGMNLWVVMMVKLVGGAETGLVDDGEGGTRRARPGGVNGRGPFPSWRTWSEEWERERVVNTELEER